MTMTCPYCDEQLRFGVRVCRGCQAEIRYERNSYPWFLKLILSWGSFYYVYSNNLTQNEILVFCGIGALLGLWGLRNIKMSITDKTINPIFERQHLR